MRMGWSVETLSSIIAVLMASGAPVMSVEMRSALTGKDVVSSWVESISKLTWIDSVNSVRGDFMFTSQILRAFRAGNSGQPL
jgi:hypothetical protein